MEFVRFHRWTACLVSGGVKSLAKADTFPALAMARFAVIGRFMRRA